MDNTKYIGMDVHKETISVAVLNSSGKLVMESVLETKAITIVEYVRGLRGDLHVTLEEGTWAAWLYDLLRPHVTEVVVCDPRKNALLRRRRERSHRCTQAGRVVVPGQAHGGLSRRARRARPEGVVAQLSDDQWGSGSRDDTLESVVPQLGHSLRGQASLCAALSGGVAGEDSRSRCAPSGGVLLSATR